MTAGLVTIAVASAIVGAIAIWRAPLGWQDERGFHLGIPPGEDD